MLVMLVLFMAKKQQYADRIVSTLTGNLRWFRFAGVS
jgi:hypothetical protein